MIDEDRAPAPSPSPSKRLGQMLLERGAITGEQLLRAVESQQSVGGRIGTCLLEMDVLDEDILLDTLSQQLAVPPVPVTSLRHIDHQILGLVPAQVAKRCQAVPFASSESQVSVAIMNVHDLATLDELAFCTSKRVTPYIANEARIFQALERHYGHTCPSRYTHILDRLEGQTYTWREGALLSDGRQALSDSWTDAQDRDGSDGSKLERDTAEIDSVHGNNLDDGITVTLPVAPDDLPSEAPTAQVNTTPQMIDGVDITDVSSLDVSSLDVSGAEAPPSTPSAADKIAMMEPLVARRPEPEPPAEEDPEDDITTQEMRTDDPVLFGQRVEPVEDITSARRPPSPFNDIERLLNDQSDREVIGQILLRTLSSAFRRSAIFKVHRRRLRGWLSRGEGFDSQLFAELELSLEDSSVFRHLQQGSEIYIGPLPHSPAHRRMACTWGGDLPKDCLMMPIRVRDRMVCVVYVDNGTDGLRQPDVDGLRLLVHRASLAFEWCILLKKSQQPERGR